MTGGSLQLSAPADALLDEALAGVRLRGAGPQPEAVWRVRLRDDEDRVWRAIAPSPDGLAGALVPAKATTGTVAALASLRPVALDLRVELPDGRAVARTVSRRILGEGVRVRRWRQGLDASLYLPAGAGPFPVATLGPLEGAATLPVAAALLASRGVLCVTLAKAADPAAVAALVDAIPSADRGMRHEVPLPPIPPGVGVRGAGAGPEAAADRAAAWDALLAELGAHPRAT